MLIPPSLDKRSLMMIFFIGSLLGSTTKLKLEQISWHVTKWYYFLLIPIDLGAITLPKLHIGKLKSATLQLLPIR